MLEGSALHSFLDDRRGGNTSFLSAWVYVIDLTRIIDASSIFGKFFLCDRKLSFGRTLLYAHEWRYATSESRNTCIHSHDCVPLTFGSKCTPAWETYLNYLWSPAVDQNIFFFLSSGVQWKKRLLSLQNRRDGSRGPRHKYFSFLKTAWNRYWHSAMM